MIRVKGKPNKGQNDCPDEASLSSELCSERLTHAVTDGDPTDHDKNRQIPTPKKRSSLRSAPKYENADEKEKRSPATSAAFRILQSGANSKKMLRDKLLKKGFSGVECEAAIEECLSLGFVKERELLLTHTLYLANKRHFGKKRIRMELYKKFDRETVEKYFDEALEEIDFQKNAREEALKLLRRGKSYLVRHLALLGYSSHEVYEALKDLPFDTGENHSDDGELFDCDPDET